MSMITYFVSVLDADLPSIVANPKLLHALESSGEISQESSVTAKPSFFAKLFGSPSKSAAASTEKSWRPQQPSEIFDTDKAWHGIHFLLTNQPWEGDGPLAFILHGGALIKEDRGYGDARGFSSNEVKAISAALKGITPEQLYAKADQKQFTENDIYPSIWDRESKEECIGYVTTYFGELKAFITKLAESNRGMIVYMS